MRTTLLLALIISARIAYPQVGACDVNQDGRVDASDILSIAGEALGSVPPSDFLSITGAIGVADIQQVLIAAMGMGCSPSPGIEAQAKIGSAGGTITVSDPNSTITGTQLTLPPGAVNSSLTLSLSSSPPTVPPGIMPVGPMLVLTPAGLNFTGPVTINIPYQDEDNDGIVDGTDIAANTLRVFTSEDNVTWAELPVIGIDLQSHFVTVATSHFSVLTAGGPVTSAAVWDFTSLELGQWPISPDTVFDDAHSTPSSLSPVAFGLPASGSLDGETLRLVTRAHGQDRIKVDSLSTFGDGTYSWRIFVPVFNPHDQVSVGAFALGQHSGCSAATPQFCAELDFEIGYGVQTYRNLVQAGANDPNDVLVFMTSQGLYAGNAVLTKGVAYTSSACSIGGNCSALTKLRSGSWHQLTLTLQKKGANLSSVAWSVDGTLEFSLLVGWDSVPLHIYNSVENLAWMGDNPPITVTTAYFDRVTYTPTSSSQTVLVEADQQNVPAAPSPGWTRIESGSPARLSQSFVPSQTPLVGIDLDLITGNPGSGGGTVTLRVKDTNGNTLGSVARYLADGTNGLVRYSFPGTGLAVTPDNPYIIEVDDNSRFVFGWKYNSDTYSLGTAYLYGQPWNGSDLRFITYTTGHWVQFTLGDPGIPGDGILITSQGDGLLLLPTPISLATPMDGFTVSTFGASTSFAPLLEVANTTCTMTGGFFIGIDYYANLTVNGVQGVLMHISEDYISQWLDFRTTYYPQCGFTRANVYLAGVELYGGNYNPSIGYVDAVSMQIGRFILP